MPISRGNVCFFGTFPRVIGTFLAEDGGGGGISLPVVTCHNRPSEVLCSGCGFLQAALQAAPLLAWSCPQYAISDGGLAVGSVPTCGRALCGGGPHFR